MTAQQIIAILEREETNADNAPDMRRVMRDERLTLVAALQRKPVRGDVVRYDGAGEAEFGGVSARDVSERLHARMAEALSTLRLWRVKV